MSIKKNILIVTGVFLPEPVVSAQILYDLALELSFKYNVIVLRPKPSRPMGFKLPHFDSTKLPFKVIQLKSYIHPSSNLIGRFLESYSMGKNSVDYIKNNNKNIDLIYNAPWQLIGRFMIYKIAKKFSIPFITPVQDVYPESILSKLPKFSFFHKVIMNILLPLDIQTLSNSEIIHTISNKMKNYLIESRNIEKSKFVVINNWQNENQFINYKSNKNIELHPSKNLFTFMYLGNIGPLAGLEILIDAFIKSNIKNSILVIAGSGSSKEKLRTKAENNQNIKIQFWDVPDGHVPRVQDAADIMILPVKKGFSSTSVPSKLPAYMFSGKPVIAAVDEYGDTAQSVLNSKCGWICSPENIDELANKMIVAHGTSKTKLNQMGELGFKYAIKFFSRKNNLKKLSSVCETILLK
jgi:glycosyltransferase involved in cell wall biosynthesis